MRYVAIIFFILCSCVFAQSNINEDTIHFVGQASAFTVGSELVTNGIFAADTDWIKTNGTPSGWSIGSGVATCNASQSVDTDLKQSITGLTLGRVYRIQYEVVTYNAGNVTAIFADLEIGDKTSVGVYTAYIAADGTSVDVIIRGDASFDGLIDNVSVVAWVGDLNAAGVSTLSKYTGTLLDYMTATGGVLHNDSGLALSDDGGSLAIAAATTWDQTPKVGTLVKCDFSATFTDGIYEIITASSSAITIDLSSAGLGIETVEVWIGGAYPDIATAMNDSTLAEDPDGTYRKRYICVNVDQEVDALTNFVAETSETAHREDDGSRKIIGFYDSISVVNPGAGGDTGSYGYRIVSDMDEGQTYYAGARKAFNSVEGFPLINPDGKWIEWNAKGNDFGATGIVVLDTSNAEFRNFHMYNTIADSGTEGLIHVDTANFNTTFINFWFAASSRWQVNDTPVGMRNTSVDCYFDKTLEVVSFVDWTNSAFKNCIFNGTSRTTNVDNVSDCRFNHCIVYKGNTGLKLTTGSMAAHCNFIAQTVNCVRMAAAGHTQTLFYNNIFSPVAIGDIAISAAKGSISPAGYSNIMFSVAAGAPLTNPIVHDQITPNPPLPVGTLEVDPLFVNYAQGDYRVRAGPALNGGIRSLFDGYSTIGANGPYSSPNAGYRSRYNFKGHNYSDR